MRGIPYAGTYRLGIVAVYLPNLSTGCEKTICIGLLPGSF
jgi:hypothetical protein